MLSSNIVKLINCFSRGSAFALLLTSVSLSLTLSTWAAPLKVRVSSQQAASRLQTQGARLLADYGSFQLLEVDDGAPALTLTSEIERADEFNIIELNASRLDTRTAAVKARRKSVGGFAGRKFHLIQFVGPIKPEWRAALEQTGVRIVHYIPQNAYLVHGDTAALTALQSWAGVNDFVQWEGDYANDYRIHPKALASTQSQPLTPVADTFAIQLLDDAELNAATLALLDSLKLAPLVRRSRALNYVNIIVRLPPDRLAEVAAQPDVVSIHLYTERKKRDERQDQIMAGNLSGGLPTGPGYLAWLAGKGFTQEQFTTSGFVVDVTDSGLDNGTTLPGHFGIYTTGNKALASRVVYNRLEGTPNSGSTLQGCDGHGNLNAHIIGGYCDVSGTPFTDASGYHYGLGVCPFVKLGSSVIFDPDFFTFPDLVNLQSRAYHDGVRISGNSWGGDGDGAYDSESQTYDELVRDAQPTGSAFAAAGNQQMVIVFAAGNDGSGSATVAPPGTGKNLITVGAAENVQAFGGTDGSGISDSGANNANDIISFSSRGPCQDGRKKPDLCAPGTHVSGGVAQVGSPGATGTAIACYDGSGVSGGSGGSMFFPSGQQFYTASSGTSHSTPAVAGSCALIRQNFLNHALAPPSPAMTKAFLMNSARYLTGVSANDTLWSNAQGMGEVNLGMAFDGVPRILRDQLNVDKFTATGQTRTFAGLVADGSKPFRVTLAWTDAPGSTSGSAYNNNLNLTVTVGENTYKGNVFSGANSITGGTADGQNNVESVFLPAGVSGTFSVTVTAANIPSDGVPNEAPVTDQDFALVIYNGTESSLPVLSPESWELGAETCAPANARVDPGETVTVNFALRNVGSGEVTNLVATLQASGGVFAPSAPQDYGLVATNGTIVSRSFTFVAGGLCGDSVTATLALTGNGMDLGSVLFSLPTGISGIAFAQNFDGVSVPDLPEGWVSTTNGFQGHWVTTVATPDTSPNAVFTAEASAAGVNELTTPVIAMPSGPAQLTFRHSYDIEANSGSATAAYDGAVLEIKIGGDEFRDVVIAGGNFTQGGYNRTISSGSSNPLAGRSVWSGDSGGFTTVTVNLPAAAAGQNVQLRWRCGTDNSIGGAGWLVDSISLSAMLCCGDVVPPTLTAPPQSQTVTIGNPVTFSVVAVGTGPLGYQWRFYGTNLSGATSTSYSIASAQASNAGPYSVVVSNLAGTTMSTNAVLTVQSPNIPTIIARWNFNSLSPDGSTGTGTTAPSFGAGTATLIGGATATFAAGAASDTNSPTDNSGWNSSSYPALTTGNKSAGVQFAVSTVGREKIAVSWEQRASGSASKYVRLQYSTNGTTFTDFPTPVAMSAVNSFEAKSNSLSAVTAADDNPNFAVRIVSEFESTAINSANVKYVTTAGATYGSSGTIRYDQVTIWGQPIPGSSTPAINLGPASYTTNGECQFTLTGVPGFDWIVEGSEDLLNWTPLATNSLPFTFTDTNGVGLPLRFYRAKLWP